MTDKNEKQAAAETTKQLTLKKIYIKDCSWECPNAPQVFTNKEYNPNVALNMNTTTNLIGENTHEVVLSVSLEAKVGESTAFLIELEQAGIFIFSGYADEEMKFLLGATCPAMLYPYVREAMSDFVTKGGFPQLLLQPVNFDELYAQADMEQQAQQAEG